MPIIPVVWQCLNVLPKMPVLEISPQHSCVMGGGSNERGLGREGTWTGLMPFSWELAR